MPDSEPVKLWREKFKLNLSASWKADVEKTITDLDLWKSLLDSWWYIDSQGKKRTKHPGIKNLLTEYERRLQNIQSDHKAGTLPARCRAGLSEGRDSFLSKVPSEAERLYFRVGDVVR